ncbi:MAG TPA: hypothetical protein VLA12_07780 [Planctomycetaceae bacterium]|nr:hypothetical protein [Planctomycetaceae bacterium]
MVNILDSQHRVKSVELRAFIDTHPADDDVKRPLYNAIDAYQRIRQSADAVDDNLDPIVAAAACKNHPVGTFGRSLLLNLVLDYPQARHAVDELIENGKAKLRSDIVFAAGIYAPACDYKRDVIRRCLDDRASSVRRRAIESSDKSMLSDLLHRQEIENDDSLK